MMERYKLTFGYLLVCLIAGSIAISTPLGAIEIGLEMGLSRNKLILENIQSPLQETQSGNPAKAFIGLTAKQNLSNRIKLGAKLLYSRRDFGESITNLESRADYLDLHLHPIVRLSTMELYAGPSISTLLSADSEGGIYPDAISEDYNAVVPGLHAGLRYPADTDAGLSFDIAYSRDFLPFSDTIGADKYREMLMLGINLRLIGKEPRLRTIWRAIDRIDTEQRINMGISLSGAKDDFIFSYVSAYEYMKRLGPLGLGAEFNITAGSILPEDGFGVWTNIMVGPQAGIKLGNLEPYGQILWGVVPLFIFEEDHPDSGLHPSRAWETGLRMHLAEDIALDLRYTAQTFYQEKELVTFGVGISMDMD